MYLIQDATRVLILIETNQVHCRVISRYSAPGYVIFRISNFQTDVHTAGSDTSV